MADPVETPEAGTGENGQNAEIIEDAPVTDTPADDSADGGEEAVGDEGAAVTETAGESHVPYKRFASVNERRKAAELENVQLKAKLEAMAPKPEPAKPPTPKDKIKGTLTQAPADMTPLEQMEHYFVQAIEAHPELMDNWFQGKFGMPADQAAATLAHSTTTTRETIRSQFEKACGERGLDPKNPAVRDAVGRMMDSKQYNSFGEAMDVFVKPKQNGTAPKKPVGKGAETSGVDVAGLTSAVKGILSKEEAGKLAEKGQRVPHQSITEILGIH